MAPIELPPKSPPQPSTYHGAVSEDDFGEWEVPESRPFTSDDTHAAVPLGARLPLSTAHSSSPGVVRTDRPSELLEGAPLHVQKYILKHIDCAFSDLENLRDHITLNDFVLLDCRRTVSNGALHFTIVRKCEDELNRKKTYKDITKQWKYVAVSHEWHEKTFKSPITSPSPSFEVLDRDGRPWRVDIPVLLAVLRCALARGIGYAWIEELCFWAYSCNWEETGLDRDLAVSWIHGAFQSASACFVMPCGLDAFASSKTPFTHYLHNTWTWLQLSASRGKEESELLLLWEEDYSALEVTPKKTVVVPPLEAGRRPARSLPFSKYIHLFGFLDFLKSTLDGLQGSQTDPHTIFGRLLVANGRGGFSLTHEYDRCIALYHWLRAETPPPLHGGDGNAPRKRSSIFAAQMCWRGSVDLASCPGIADWFHFLVKAICGLRDGGAHWKQWESSARDQRKWYRDWDLTEQLLQHSVTMGWTSREQQLPFWLLVSPEVPPDPSLPLFSDHSYPYDYCNGYTPPRHCGRYPRNVDVISEAVTIHAVESGDRQEHAAEGTLNVTTGRLKLSAYARRILPSPGKIAAPGKLTTVQGRRWYVRPDGPETGPRAWIVLLRHIASEDFNSSDIQNALLLEDEKGKTYITGMFELNPRSHRQLWDFDAPRVIFDVTLKAKPTDSAAGSPGNGRNNHPQFWQPASSSLKSG